MEQIFHCCTQLLIFRLSEGRQIGILGEPAVQNDLAVPDQALTTEDDQQDQKHSHDDIGQAKHGGELEARDLQATFKRSQKLRYHGEEDRAQNGTAQRKHTADNADLHDVKALGEVEVCTRNRGQIMSPETAADAGEKCADRKAADLLATTPVFPITEDTGETGVMYTFEEKKKDIIIEKEDDGVWNVSGPRLERVFDINKLNTEEDFYLFANKMRYLGIDTALREAGCQDGDTVRLLGFEFEEQLETKGIIIVKQVITLLIFFIILTYISS